jgi:hypothetical protein
MKDLKISLTLSIDKHNKIPIRLEEIIKIQIINKHKIFIKVKVNNNILIKSNNNRNLNIIKFIRYFIRKFQNLFRI